LFLYDDLLYDVISQSEYKESYLKVYNEPTVDDTYIQTVRAHKHKYIQTVRAHKHKYIRTVPAHKHKYIRTLPAHKHKYILTVPAHKHKYIQTVPAHKHKYIQTVPAHKHKYISHTYKYSRWTPTCRHESTCLTLRPSLFWAGKQQDGKDRLTRNVGIYVRIE
jgi:hypothetical protein